MTSRLHGAAHTTDADTNGALNPLPPAGTTFDAAQHDDGKIPYTVTIRATDPSGATGEKDVTVILKDVNEAPEFSTGSKNQATLYIDENADRCCFGPEHA